MSDQGYQPNSFAFDEDRVAPRVAPPAAYQLVSAMSGPVGGHRSHGPGDTQVADIDGDFAAVAARFAGPDSDPAEIEAPASTVKEFDLNEVLIQLLEAGGSDLHITTGASPAMRVNGERHQME